jgi:hypothetical protein
MFRNDRKEKETQPDWRGDIMINGTLMEISSWWNEEKGFHSLSVSEKKPFTPGETQQRSDRQEQRQSAPPMRQERQDGSRLYPAAPPVRPARETMDTVFTDGEDIPF